LEPNISFLLFKKLANWDQNYKYNLQSGYNWEPTWAKTGGQTQNLGLLIFGLQKDNGANFEGLLNSRSKLI